MSENNNNKEELPAAFFQELAEQSQSLLSQTPEASDTEVLDVRTTDWDRFFDGVNSIRGKLNGYAEVYLTHHSQEEGDPRPRRGIIGHNFPELIHKSFLVYYDLPYLAVFSPDAYQQNVDTEKLLTWYTYGAIFVRICNFGMGLLDFVQKGSFVGICAPNRVEWIVADFAAVFQAIVTVPIHTNADQQQIEYMINHTDLTVMILSRDMLDKFVTAEVNCPTLQYLILMDDDISEAEFSMIQQSFNRLKVMRFQDVEYCGANAANRIPIVNRSPEDIHSIVFTSGSTGAPKGAIISEHRWHTFCSVHYLMPSPIIHLSYAPLSHIMERQHISITTTYGAKIIMSRDPSNLMYEIQAVCPTWLSCPPRVWNQIYAEFQLDLADGVKEYKNDFLKRHASPVITVNPTNDNNAPPPAPDISSISASRLPSDESIISLVTARIIKSKYRNILGGKQQYIVTGGAPTSPAVLKFLRQCFSCPVYDGYGSTEVGSIATDNCISATADVRLEDVPELGYTTKDIPCPRGEILVKTSTMFSGYYKNDEATQASFTPDGYFRSGDIGMKLPDGRILIIDRKKNMFKLSQAEFVAPEYLENLFLESVFIDQIYIHGDSFKSFLVAVVIPKKQYLKTWAQEQGIPTDEKSLSENSLVKQAILNSMQDIGQKQRLKPFEVPRNIYISFELFTTENGLLTPSIKLKRHAIHKRYEKELEALWKESSDQNILLKLLSKVSGVEPDSNTFQFSLENLAADSLSTVRLLNLIKETFKTEIPLNVLFAAKSVDDIANYIQSQSAKQVLLDPLYPNVDPTAIADLKAIPSIVEDGFRQIDERLGISRDHITPRPMLNYTGDCLLTGVTGFLGIHLLYDLLKRTTYEVHVLVRVDKKESYKTTAALDRLRKKAAEAKLELSDMEWQRVNVLVGSLDEPLLGLKAMEFHSLAGSISSIYHCGALVNWVYGYSACRAPNVMSLIPLLYLASYPLAPKSFHFISTLGAAEYPEEVPNYTEGTSKSLEEHKKWMNTQLIGGYSQSKYVAEKLVQYVMRQYQVPAVIYRPGMITGHSQSGHCNPDDFICRLLRGFLFMGCYIANDTVPVDMTPVDYISAAIVHISMKPGCTNQIYHLCNNNFNIHQPVHYSELGKAVRDFMQHVHKTSSGIVPVPYSTFRRQLGDSDAKNPLYGLISYFPQPPSDKNLDEDAYIPGMKAAYITNTLAAIQDDPLLRFPKVSLEMLYLQVKYLAENNYLLTQ